MANRKDFSKFSGIICLNLKSCNDYKMSVMCLKYGIDYDYVKSLKNDGCYKLWIEMLNEDDDFYTISAYDYKDSGFHVSGYLLPLSKKEYEFIMNITPVSIDIKKLKKVVGSNLLEPVYINSFVKELGTTYSFSDN